MIAYNSIERAETMKKIACILIVFVCLLCIHTSSFADSIKLPSGLIEIKEEAFYQDTNITEVEVPAGTKSIGARAFANSGLQRIFLPDTIEKIDPTAFDDLSQGFVIVAPYNSYGFHFAIHHHFGWGESSYNSFMQWMLQNVDENGNKLFDEYEINRITTIDCSDRRLTTLDGIELFHNLLDLNCSNNSLTHLDVHNNPKLTRLACYSEQLARLNVSNNPSLTKLFCGGNQLTDLDLSSLTSLAEFHCAYN